MTKNIFIANSADVVGKVCLEENTSIWFQAVLRGDCNSIVVGKGSNVQDGSVVHVDRESPVKIGENVTIGHNCTIHGCTIENNVLVGMGSIVLNDAVIGENTIIGAGSLVTQNKKIPANSLVLGSPAKVIRPLTEEEIASIQKNAISYVETAKTYEGKDYFVDNHGWINIIQ